MLVNQILFFCNADTLVNVLHFVRSLFEQRASFEAIAQSVNVSALSTKLFDCVMNEHRFKNKWSSTQKLLFLWTLYKVNQSGHIAADYLRKALKWSGSVFDDISFDELALVFADKSIDLLADFSSALEGNVNVNEMKDEELFVVDVALKV